MKRKYQHTARYLHRKYAEGLAKNAGEMLDAITRDQLVAGFDPNRKYIPPTFAKRMRAKIKEIRKSIAEWIYGDVIYEDYD
jgi:hypothetical protein